MAGYIGSKAVNLSTTGADINGDANIDGDLSFRDNDKIKLGAGSDLQIYHSGTHSYIQDLGTGSLRLVGADIEFLNEDFSDFFAKFANNGASTFYYDGSPKLATTSTGIDVTGTVTADGLTVDGDGQINQTAGNASTLTFTSNGQASRYSRIKVDTDRSLILTAGVGAVNETPDIKLQTGTATGEKDRILIDGATGDISFYEDTGTTAKFFWDASLEALTLGGNEWPSSTIGELAGRHMINYDGEPRLLLWDASTGAAGNEAHIMIGGKPVSSATQFSGATISAGVENGTDADGYLAISTTNAASTSVEHMRIDSSGHLQLSGSTDNVIRSGLDSSRVRIFGGGTESVGNGAALTLQGVSHSGGNYADLASATGGYINFRIGTSNAMRIDSSGNVGIGTTSPSAPLEVTRSTEGIAQYITNTGSNQAYTAYGNSDNPPWSQDFNTAGGLLVGIDSDESGVLFQGGNYDLRLGTNGTDRMRITSGGSIKMPNVYNDTTASAANLHISSAGGQLFRSTSSARYKNTIANASFGIVELMALRPVTYKGNNDGDTVFGGLIAEEVHDAGLVEFVQYNEEGEPDALAYGNMVSLCIKAIQEQQATITDLKARVATLEAN